MPDASKIRRALISVYDKTGIVDFARALHDEFGVEIISTGGTAITLTDAGIPVTLVEEITGFPEMLDGRVKTLHPKIHAAILADRDNPEHMRQLREQGIEPIDMVVVNLYPFEETIRRPECTLEEAIEMIDIGGPCLLRAAAKNHKHVLVISDRAQSEVVLQNLRGAAGVVDADLRVELAAEAYDLTSLYDEWITLYLERTAAGRAGEPPFRVGQERLRLPIRNLHQATRYGENPHQHGAAYMTGVMSPHHGATVLNRRELSGIDLSFNNYVDANAALALCAELTRAGKSHHKLWYRLPAGHSEPAGSPDPAGSSDESDSPQRASSPPKSIPGETLSRRYLPHIQSPGRTYSVTFRTRGIKLPDKARDLALSACKHWHERRMTLHIAVVMPDHVHLLLTPYLYADGSAIPLAELVHSIKSYSANQINRLLDHQGPLWMQERWDRIMRHEREFIETWEYIEANPERSGLGRDYRWMWKSAAGFEEGGWVGDQLEAGTTKGNRLEADTTSSRTHSTEDRLEADTTEAAGTRFAICCFIKHTNACGVAVAPVSSSDPEDALAAQIDAYARAYLGDPNAAMGGILAVNFNVDAAFAEAVMQTYQRLGKALKEAGAAHAPGAFFVEVWLAPSFDEQAVRIIRGEVEGKPQKAWGKRVRLLDVGDMSVEPDPSEMDFKRIAGGVLLQTRDLVGLNEDRWEIVTERQPTDAEMNDLRLAWLICKHTKSNAITICAGGMLIGNGAGQMSRVMSGRIATWLAKENGHADLLKGAAAASDAFFPFRDGPDVLADAGVTAMIQPGGSKRDAEVITACNERNVAMVFTGTRHFRH